MKTCSRYEIEKCFDAIFPICRSITGNGVRETLRILSKITPLQLNETPTGTEVFDWEIPLEWNVREAYIENEEGGRIIDFNNNNLHLVGYSEPIEKWVSKEELERHLHSDEKLPSAIPYVTSYYKKDWGFCISHQQRENLLNGKKFFVKIDTDLKAGSLTWAHAYLQGRSKKEFIFSTYVCHPSLANNELSGPLVAIFLLEQLRKQKNLNYSYRFIFAPETVGTINFIHSNLAGLKENLLGGLILTCIGDSGKYTYKKTFSGCNLIDRMMEEFLENKGPNEVNAALDFFPWGSDERQYNSPGLRLPVGCLSRTIYGKYPEYHTSLDNKSVLNFTKISQTVDDLLKLILDFENTWFPVQKDGRCEPKLDKYGLYKTTSQTRINSERTNAIRWCLSLADGQHSLCMIAKRSGLELQMIEEVAKELSQKGLLL